TERRAETERDVAGSRQVEVEPQCQRVEAEEEANRPEGLGRRDDRIDPFAEDMSEDQRLDQAEQNPFESVEHATMVEAGPLGTEVIEVLDRAARIGGQKGQPRQYHAKAGWAHIPASCFDQYRRRLQHEEGNPHEHQTRLRWKRDVTAASRLVPDKEGQQR